CRSGIFAANRVVKPAYTVFMVIGPPLAGIAAKMPLLQSSVQSNTASGFQRSEHLRSSVSSIFRPAFSIQHSAFSIQHPAQRTSPVSHSNIPPLDTLQPQTYVSNTCLN